jgi:hypothetical protein
MLYKHEVQYSLKLLIFVLQKSDGTRVCYECLGVHSIDIMMHSILGMLDEDDTKLKVYDPSTLSFQIAKGVVSSSDSVAPWGVSVSPGCFRWGDFVYISWSN